VVICEGRKGSNGGPDSLLAFVRARSRRACAIWTSTLPAGAPTPRRSPPPIGDTHAGDQNDDENGD